MDWRLIVPKEGTLTKEETDAAYEIRLRCGQPLQLFGPQGQRTGSWPLTQESIRLAAQALTGHSLSMHEIQLKEGFVPLPGGHRMGVCGHMGKNGLYVFSSLCVRMAHEIKDAAETIYPLVKGENVLILGPPGSGKTTLLRDLIRRTAQEKQVAVIDSRGEIAACFQGVPQLDIGPGSDVMTGGRKDEMMMTMLRAMSPQVMAADEIGSTEDTSALLEMHRCGVKVMATAHGDSLAQARGRQSLKPLFDTGVFRFVLLLSCPGHAPRCIDLCEK